MRGERRGPLNAGEGRDGKEREGKGGREGNRKRRGEGREGKGEGREMLPQTKIYHYTTAQMSSCRSHCVDVFCSRVSRSSVLFIFTVCRPVFCRNGETYPQTISSLGSHIILVFLPYQRCGNIPTGTPNGQC